MYIHNTYSVGAQLYVYTYKVETNVPAYVFTWETVSFPKVGHHLLQLPGPLEVESHIMYFI